jgi:single-strand DNA-binding protein
MLNNVSLVGRLTKDVELRYTPSNVAVATFTLAVNRTFKNENGDREADFINCVMWRQQAENLANWAKKGALIGITGRIQTRSYDNQQGQRVYVTEVVAEQFQLLESRNSQGQSQGQQRQAQQEMPDFSRNANGNPLDISDDDLPF